MAAFDWDKVLGIDPSGLRKWNKDQLDEVFNAFVLVIAHPTHSAVEDAPVQDVLAFDGGTAETVDHR